MYSNKDDTPSSTGLPHRINTPSLGPKTMLGSSKAHSPSGREPLMTSPIASSQSSNGESGEGNYNQLWATGDPPQQRLEGVFKSREEVTDDFQSMFYGDPTLYSNIARAGSGSKEGSTLRKNRQPEDGYEGKGGTTDFLRQASNSSDSNFESNSSYAEQVKRTALSASNEGGSPVRKENQHQADAGSRHPQQGPPPRRKVLRYTAPQLLEAFEELDPPENLPDVPAITTQECLPPASFTPFDPLEFLKPWQKELRTGPRVRQPVRRDGDSKPALRSRNSSETAEENENRDFGTWRSTKEAQQEQHGGPNSDELRQEPNKSIHPQSEKNLKETGKKTGPQKAFSSNDNPGDHSATDAFDYSLFSSAFEAGSLQSTDMSSFLQQMTNSISSLTMEPENTQPSATAVGAIDSSIGVQQQQQQSAVSNEFQQPGQAMWYYKDPKGNVQGPFPADNMRVWLHAGYFKADLPIRCGHSGEFLPLSNYFSSIQQAFVEPPRTAEKQQQHHQESAVNNDSVPAAVPELRNVQPTEQTPEQLARSIQAAHNQLNNWLAEHSNAIAQYRQLEQAISSLSQNEQQYRQVLSQCTSAIQSIEKGTFRQLPEEQQVQVQHLATHAQSYYNAHQDIRNSLENKIAYRNSLSKDISERANLIEAGKLQLSHVERQLQKMRTNEQYPIAHAIQHQSRGEPDISYAPVGTSVAIHAPPNMPEQTTTQFSPVRQEPEGRTGGRKDWREDAEAMRDLIAEKKRMQSEEKRKREEEAQKQKQDIERQKAAVWGNTKSSQAAKPIREQFQEINANKTKQNSSHVEATQEKQTAPTNSRNVYQEIMPASAGWTNQASKGKVKSLLEIQREEAAKQQAIDEQHRQEKQKAVSEVDKRAYDAVRDSKPHTPSSQVHTLGRGSMKAPLSASAEKAAWGSVPSGLSKEAPNNEGFKAIKKNAMAEKKKQDSAQQRAQAQKVMEAAQAQQSTPWGVPAASQQQQPMDLRQIKEAQKRAEETQLSAGQGTAQTSAPRSTRGMTMAQRLTANSSGTNAMQKPQRSVPVPQKPQQGIWGEDQVRANPPPPATKASSIAQQRENSMAQQKAPSQLSKQAAQRSSTSKETNFWEQVASSKTKTSSRESATQSAGPKSSNEFGGQSMSKPFQDWCQVQMKKLTGNTDMTLPNFCMTLETGAEIRTYLTTYLGNSEKVEKFAAEFIANKEADSTSSGWTSPRKGKKR